MAADFSYDPVTAVDEATATGEVAAVFADIRATMGIPLVTSIWRGLADIDTSLTDVWALSKPIFLTGGPEHALARVVAHVDLPEPEPLVPGQLACVGVGARDLAHIRTILAAYNRSNGMNLLALAALVTPPTPAASDAPAPPTSPVWPAFPALLSREAIGAEPWRLIREVNAFGAAGIDAHVATLWRHLAHWPGLLALVHCAFAPLQARGTIAEANAQLVALAQAEGARMAALRPAVLPISPRAFDTISRYVDDPMQVGRMVTLGHAIARWLS